MAASIHDILNARQTTTVVSQIMAKSSHLLSLFGMSSITDPQSSTVSNGPNTRQVGRRETAWDIFNNTRIASRMRAPGTPSAIISRQAVGRQSATIPRSAEALRLLSEEIYNFRRIGGHGGEFDERGEEYIRSQLRILGQRSANWRTTLLVGMLRDSLHIGFTNGDDQYLIFDPTSVTDPTRQINFQVPAGNKSSAVPGLDPLGTGDIIDASWATATTDIPSHLAQIDAAFQQLSGTRLELIITTHKVWNAVNQNTAVRNMAGSSNSPFETSERRLPATDASGAPINDFVGRLRGFPWIDWWVTDEIIELGPPGSEVAVKHIDDDFAWFGMNPDPVWTEMHLGGEAISEGFGRREELRVGLHTWTKQLDDPAGHMLMSVDNVLPVVYIPKSMMYAQVI